MGIEGGDSITGVGIRSYYSVYSTENFGNN